MDPNATLRQIIEARTRGEQREATTHLYTWILRGGFYPEPIAMASVNASPEMKALTDFAEMPISWVVATADGLVIQAHAPGPLAEPELIGQILVASWDSLIDTGDPR